MLPNSSSSPGISHYREQKLVGMSEEGTSSLIPMETMPPTQGSSTQQNGYSIPLGTGVQGGGGYEEEEEESEDEGSDEES